MLLALEAAPRAPRSLTVHFVSRPEEGPCEVAVRVARAGRSLHTLLARLEQDGEPRAVALGAFSPGWTGPELEEGPGRPAAPDPEGIPVLPAVPPTPEFFSHVEFRPVHGPALGAGTGPMAVGGWMRTRPALPVDPLVAGFLLDALWPAPYGRLPAPLPAPTIDLTVHFRRELPATPVEEPVLATFATRLVHDGFFEEDGELWSRDGRLLAQSRQLALLRSA
jgi:acyl-CoA thioesterase